MENAEQMADMMRENEKQTKEMERPWEEVLKEQREKEAMGQTEKKICQKTKTSSYTNQAYYCQIKA